MDNPAANGDTSVPSQPDPNYDEQQRIDDERISACLADISKGLDDLTDAWGFGSSSSKGAVGVMPVSRDAIFYNMKHPRRGMAVIFNHEHFDNASLSVRTGTNVDVKNITETLQYHGFEVTIHKDLRWKEMEYIIEKAATSDHSDADCFMVVVLSHGEEGTLYARDLPYKPERLWAPFDGTLCPTLAGKPKMFFIQACQGDKLDAGVTLKQSEFDGYKDSLSYKIPSQADFLIVYSTIPGYYSWRNTTRGSWFMQSLCKVLRTHGHEGDLMSMLTIVNRYVAFDFESNSSIPHMHSQKQIPCITSMLTRLIRLGPKEPTKP